MKQINDKTKIWADIEKIEPSAIEQILAISQHPRLFRHVAIMPDVHSGIGATIGSVIPVEDAIIPSAVGVDIGCGMCAVETGIHLSDFGTDENKQKLFHSIYRGITESIPRGFAHRNAEQEKAVHDYVPNEFISKVRTYESSSIWNQKSIVRQLGTLGGGNHFIELQIDEKGFIWIMLHSGSRNIGNIIAKTYIKKATDLANASKDLEYIDINSPDGISYLENMSFATDFAFYNRKVMMECVSHVLRNIFGSFGRGIMINIHHNYVNKERHFGADVWVHRKGATRVTSDIKGIIPGSMGTSSYIVSGTNNEESFNSCSHGAGRIMSRNAARGKIDRKSGGLKSEGVLTLDDFKVDMVGVFSHEIDRHHLDEAPRAYKNIDEVMDNQKDLVSIVTTLKPILNIKG